MAEPVFVAETPRPGTHIRIRSPKTQSSVAVAEVATASDPALHLPRVVCLHGGGTNARIFRAQCRVLRTHLAPFFRLVFADAPFPSRPGPDVETVYADWGPFKSWMGDFCSTNVDRLDPYTVDQIDQSIARALHEDDLVGADGPCVGLLGFSQGAKLAASLLFRQQQQQQKNAGWTDEGFRFAVLLAGRAPLARMDGAAETGPLRLPTVHVHGLKDAGLALHRELLDLCEKGSTRVVEWNGAHRVPITTRDVKAVVDEIVRVARDTGLL